MCILLVVYSRCKSVGRDLPGRRLSRPHRTVFVLLALTSRRAASSSTCRLHTATMSVEEMKAAVLALAGESDDQRCGGVRDAPGCENDLGTIDLARFAIYAHNKNALTTLAPVLLSVTCKLQRLYSCSLVVLWHRLPPQSSRRFTCQTSLILASSMARSMLHTLLLFLYQIHLRRALTVGTEVAGSEGRSQY